MLSDCRTFLVSRSPRVRLRFPPHFHPSTSLRPPFVPNRALQAIRCFARLEVHALPPSTHGGGR